MESTFVHILIRPSQSHLSEIESGKLDLLVIVFEAFSPLSKKASSVHVYIKTTPG